MNKISISLILSTLFLNSCVVGDFKPEWLTHVHAASEALLNHDRDKAIEEAHCLERLDDKQPPEVIFTDGVLPSCHFGCNLYSLANEFHQEHLDDRAEALYRKAVRAEEADYGKDSPEVARNSWLHLSRFLWDVHRTDEAKAIDDRITNQFKDDPQIVLYSAESFERRGDSANEEMQLKKALKLAEGKDDTLQKTMLKKKCVETLAGFYHQRLMFDKERQVIGPWAQLEKKEPVQWTHYYWNYVTDLDLAQNKFKEALADSRKIEDERSAKEYSKAILFMINAKKYRGPISKPITKEELDKLVKASQAILVCRIDGWEISTMAINDTQAGAYITPVKALTPGLPVQPGVIFGLKHWEDPYSPASILLHLQSRNKNALILALKPNNCLAGAPIGPTNRSIPTYFDYQLTVLPADDNTIRAVEKLQSLAISSILSQGYCGIKLNNDCIAEIFPDSPAGKAGLKADDKILAIDNKSTSGKSVSAIRDMLIGPVGTTIRLTFVRKGMQHEVALTRAKSGGELSKAVLEEQGYTLP